MTPLHHGHAPETSRIPGNQKIKGERIERSHTAYQEFIASLMARPGVHVWSALMAQNVERAKKRRDAA